MVGVKPSTFYKGNQFLGNSTLLIGPIISLSYIFTPAGRMFFQEMLKNHGFTVYHDEILSDKSPCNFDFILFVNDDFTKISLDHEEDENISEQKFENEHFDANSNQDELHFYFNENDQHTNVPDIETKESNSLNDLNLWFLPSIMMKKEKSILFINVPRKEFNQNNSVNGKKLRYHHPMTDIEFQYEPMNPALIEVTLHEALERLHNNESDIQYATLAFKNWCKTSIYLNFMTIKI